MRKLVFFFVFFAALSFAQAQEATITVEQLVARVRAEGLTISGQQVTVTGVVNSSMRIWENHIIILAPVPDMWERNRLVVSATVSRGNLVQGDTVTIRGTVTVSGQDIQLTPAVVLSVQQAVRELRDYYSASEMFALSWGNMNLILGHTFSTTLTIHSLPSSSGGSFSITSWEHNILFLFSRDDAMSLRIGDVIVVRGTMGSQGFTVSEITERISSTR